MGSGSGAVVWREIASSPPPGFGRPTGSAGGTASGSERPSPAPGFGAARPSSAQSGGSKSAARTDMLVDVGMEAGSDNLEVPPHVGNESASPTKGTKRKFVVDATEGASPGVNTSNTGQHQHSRRKGKGPGKHAKLEDNKGATKLGRDQTPIGVFEDECVFCHSFRTSEPFHGPMVLYRNRRIVPSDEGNPTNAIYIHEKCMVWAPKVESNGDTFKNVESEINRSKRLRCRRCKLRGAALGCYDNSCRKSYHVPCAMMIPECRWDPENHRVWCPKHAPPDELSSPTMESDTLSPVLQNHSSQCPAKEISVDYQMEDEHINPLPCDEMSSPVIESDINSAVLQNHSSQCPAKEISGDCQMENEHISPLATSSSSLPGQVPGQYLVKGGTSVLDRREDLQVDQLNTSSSSLPQGQCSDRGRISANHRREEKLVNQSSTPVDQWVLLGISLSASEKDSLKEFASLTSSTLAEEWDKTVTHVIVGRNAGDACGRSYEVLMAILSGKWVVTAGWIVDCMVEPIPDLKTCLEKPIPGPEISYEMNFCDGSCTSGYGPTKGRARAAERAPKLFSGLHFCLSAYIDPEDRETIRRLVAAGGGQVLEGISPDRLHENLNKNPAEVYFIYDSGPPRKITSDFDLILGKEIQESIEYAKSGVQVISHTRLLDAILCYDARILERRLQQDV
ncbi:BRCA1-associated RING domain protein 1-like isoform X5 [Triticum dicoccoides]|uniref:BRCA1-associated RING domain protein 1-like isoform X5 n=1 Tax=Triticum dicoccoides TaxID=85692 RepID=UPI00188F55AC|nr:BRCA1-associated RING domain protein 1-like isoform X5 [Triticum dicoccoides]XP_044339005.1 BRCA1-associated RING domain protein 1-like isoform X10 [Triticum aestivum]